MSAAPAPVPALPLALRPTPSAQPPVASPSRSWHRPPAILPNYGHRKGMAQSSSVPRVLLHDNVSQQQLLDARLSHLAVEQRRARRLLELHKKSFLTRQSHKQQQLRDIGVNHISFLPDIIAEAHCNVSRFTSHGDNSPSNRQSPARNGNNNTAMGSGSQNRSSPLKLDARVDCLHTDVITITDGLTLDEIRADTAGGSAGVTAADRTRSAFAKSEKTFMTHDFRLRREMTYAGDRSSGASVRMTSGRARVVRDPRFVSLRKSLVQNAGPMEGFIHLSPSGRTVIQQYGTPLFDLDLLDSCIRQYPPRPPLESATSRGLSVRMRGNGHVSARRGSAASDASSVDGSHGNGYVADVEDAGNDGDRRHHRRGNRLSRHSDRRNDVTGEQDAEGE